MKLGEIKVATLKLLFVGYENDINVGDLDELSLDENYKSYLFGMNDSINRAFSSIEEKGVLPSKSYTINKADGEVDGQFIRFDLKELIPDYFSMDRVVYQNSNGDYKGHYEYQLEEDVLVLRDFKESDESLRVLYKPTLERINDDTDNDLELDIPNSIASQIPLFVKGDIYREDEPNEASEARNWFESAMSELHKNKTTNIGRVKKIFSQTE